MKTLFCCGTATHTRQGQAGMWRWWYYYRPRQSLFGATHYAVNNDSHVNLPVEELIYTQDASRVVEPFDPDRLNMLYWPEPLPRKSALDYPGYLRGLITLVTEARNQKFDRLIYVEYDFWIMSEDMMREIGGTRSGLVTYWVPRYMFAESNMFVCGQESYDTLEQAARSLASKAQHSTEDIAEVCFPWTQVHKHRVGDRYPEFTDQIPPQADYCAQLPLDMMVRGCRLIRLGWQKCSRCAQKVRFNRLGILACPNCQPENFAIPVR